MPVTPEEQAAALRAAIATGARQVQVGGTNITYRSLSEMQQALEFIEGRIPGHQQVERVFHPVTSSGL